MHYRPFGRTGVHISVLALGTMNFGRISRTRQDDVNGIVTAALDAGISLVM